MVLICFLVLFLFWYYFYSGTDLQAKKPSGRARRYRVVWHVLVRTRFSASSGHASVGPVVEAVAAPRAVAPLQGQARRDCVRAVRAVSLFGSERALLLCGQGGHLLGTPDYLLLRRRCFSRRQILEVLNVLAFRSCINKKYMRSKKVLEPVNKPSRPQGNE